MGSVALKDGLGGDDNILSRCFVMPNPWDAGSAHAHEQARPTSSWPPLTTTRSWSTSTA